MESRSIFLHLLRIVQGYRVNVSATSGPHHSGLIVMEFRVVWIMPQEKDHGNLGAV